MPSHVDEDLALLQAWRSGDAKAGSDLFGRYFDRIYAFFANKAPREAEDLAQRTFEACVETRDRFEGQASFRSYLFGIARLQLLRYYQRGLPKERAIDPQSDSVLDLRALPARGVARQERRDVVEQALDALPLDFRIVVELFYWHELSVAEVASTLDIPPGTVKSRLSRARRDLKQALTDLQASPDLIATTMSQFQRA